MTRLMCILHTLDMATAQAVQPEGWIAGDMAVIFGLPAATLWNRAHVLMRHTARLAPLQQGRGPAIAHATAAAAGGAPPLQR